MNKHKIGKRSSIIIVVTVVIVALIIGGYYSYSSLNPPQVEVKYGYAQFKYSIHNDTSITLQKNISAVSMINNGDGFLNLSIDVGGVVPVRDEILVDFYVLVRGHMPSRLIPSDLKIEAQELEKSKSSVDFDTSFNEYKNATPWDGSKELPGAWAPNPAYIGSNPHSGDFEMKTHISWEIWDFNVPKIHTLQIKAKALGFSKPIVSTVNITIDTSSLGYSQLKGSVNSDGKLNIGKCSSALAMVNNTGLLNLTVAPGAFNLSGNSMRIDLKVFVSGKMPSNFVPAGLKIEAESFDNSDHGVLYFNTKSSKFINATPWKSNEDQPTAWLSGTVYVGCTPQDNVFEFSTVMTLEIDNITTAKEHTLEIRAELLDGASGVIAMSTVDMVIGTWGV